MNLEIPGIGPLEEDPELNWHQSAPVALPLFNGAECNVVIEAYKEEDREGIFATVANLLSRDFSVLQAVEGDIYAYYQDCNADWEPGEEGYLEIATPADVWKHVQFGFEACISNHFRDGHFYVSLECNCDWEPEHGLQIVLRDGLKVNKVGAYNGHVTNSNAYGRDIADEVIYRRRGA